MYKIMIADDNPLIRMGLKSMIKWDDFQAELAGEAGRGDEVLRLLKEKETDLLIIDIRMPKIDGLHVLQEIQGRYENLDTIVVSAYNEFEYAKQALRSGSIDYILKPIDVDELNAAIKKAIEKRKAVPDRENQNRKFLQTSAVSLKMREQKFDADSRRYRMENIIMLCKSGNSEELKVIYHEIRDHALLSCGGKSH